MTLKILVSVLICLDHARDILLKVNESSTVIVVEVYLKISCSKLQMIPILLNNYQILLVHFVSDNVEPPRVRAIT